LVGGCSRDRPEHPLISEKANGVPNIEDLSCAGFGRESVAGPATTVAMRQFVGTQASVLHGWDICRKGASLFFDAPDSVLHG
jgi:hypothetical protein